EANTLPADETARVAASVGLRAGEAGSVTQALAEIVAQEPEARVLICGSLYLAGSILRENG
ncbi:bifunctional folylpolyglutamate synthase/dihydrofolate synthase, partial [Salipiger sp. HF18]|nr:bifunctional folylpolyglutamate synthase/dihydrofolate synthase [Salipiger sp. HF18]